jgi:hypothetical protein
MKTPMYKTILLLITILLFTNSCNWGKVADKPIKIKKRQVIKPAIVKEKLASSIDTTDYNKRMLSLANNDTTGRWPVKNIPYPLAGAILPYNRIIAFYGNLYSKKMGILGELPKGEMLEKLKKETDNWQAADSTVHTIPALHYIAVTAQGSPGQSNLYRMRMPFQQIDTILEWAKPIKALVFLDIQVGQGSLKEEVLHLEPYLKLPNVHLGIDPEFSLKNGEVPGTKIGTFNSDDINNAITILAKLVRENNLPPKILIVHRFTQGMVTDYKNIKTIPEVQVVMNMDGFGSKILKKSTYKSYIYREPVQFTGFKLFYKNDIKSNPNGLFTPEELLKLTPKPIYIQYQ